VILLSVQPKVFSLKPRQITAVFRSFGQQARPIFWFALLWGSVLFSALAGAAVLVEAAVVPELPTLLLLLLLAIPVSWTMVLPLAGCFAVGLGMTGWRDRGGWLAFQTSGGSGRALVPLIGPYAVLLGLVTALSGMWLEPLCRSVSRDAVLDSISETLLLPGRTVVLGEQHVQVGALVEGWYTDVLIRGPEGVAYARRGQLVAIKGGLALQLEEGSMVSMGEPSWRLEWDSWVHRLEIPVSRRIELNERDVISLWQQAARTEAAGGAADYEWAVAYKRFIHPLSAATLLLGVLPLGLRRWSAVWVGGAGLGYAFSIRVGDSLVTSMGPLVGASVGLLFCLLLCLASWLSWRER
jgi:lipopolysaccharide export LptBFGC system permease protein LptF